MALRMLSSGCTRFCGQVRVLRLADDSFLSACRCCQRFLCSEGQAHFGEPVVEREVVDQVTVRAHAGRSEASAGLAESISK